MWRTCCLLLVAPGCFSTSEGPWAVPCDYEVLDSEPQFAVEDLLAAMEVSLSTASAPDEGYPSWPVTVHHWFEPTAPAEWISFLETPGQELCEVGVEGLRVVTTHHVEVALGDWSLEAATLDVPVFSATPEAADLYTTDTPPIGFTTLPPGLEAVVRAEEGWPADCAPSYHLSPRLANLEDHVTGNDWTQVAKSGDLGSNGSTGTGCEGVRGTVKQLISWGENADQVTLTGE
jgi:hypothetical protein